MNPATGSEIVVGEGHIDDVIEVRIGPPGLEGLLRLPDAASGMVLFAHGSGSGRLSPRNNRVAEALRPTGLGTLLFDLLTEDEARDRANVFDIGLLSKRLGVAAEWVMQREDLSDLPIGYFGASTGAAAALVAAAREPERVRAVVSRGGRPDLAASFLVGVRAPTLLIVGGDDTEVLGLNRAALGKLRCEKELRIVPGATHLFEEPGALDAVVDLAKRWFLSHLSGPCEGAKRDVGPPASVQ